MTRRNKSFSKKIKKEIKVENKKDGEKENEKKPETKIIINSKSMSKKEALEKTEEKLGKVLDKVKEKNVVSLAKNLGLDEADLEVIKKLKEKGVEISFPNLKYAQPKYSNVSELIKYVFSFFSLLFICSFHFYIPIFMNKRAPD